MDGTSSNRPSQAIGEPRVVTAIILKSEPGGLEGEIETWLSMTVKTVQPIVDFVEMSVRFFKIGGKPNAAELKTLISVMGPMAISGHLADADLRDVQFLKLGSASVGQAKILPDCLANVSGCCSPLRTPEQSVQLIQGVDRRGMCMGRGRVPLPEMRAPAHVAISLDRLELLNSTITQTTPIVGRVHYEVLANGSGCVRMDYEMGNQHHHAWD